MRAERKDLQMELIKQERKQNLKIWKILILPILRTNDNTQGVAKEIDMDQRPKGIPVLFSRIMGK